MFYCEECRIINNWPKGIGMSRGPCEDCKQTRPCYDVPSSGLPKWSERRKLSLCPLIDEPGFSMDKLMGQKEFRVFGVENRSPQRTVVMFGNGELADPAADPLIIGTIAVGNDYKVRVLWDNKLWRPWDPDTDEFLGIMEGVDPAAMKDYFNKKLSK